MSWITKVALKKRWLTVLVAALVTGASVWGLLTLKMELLPDIDLPMTTVVTFYPQAQPDEVAERVTIPIEGTVAGIAGLEHVSSTTIAGSSLVFFQFEYGTDMDAANATIARNLRALDLPPEVRGLAGAAPGMDENPRLFPLDMNMMPVVTLSLNGDIPVDELEQVAETLVLPRLNGVDGVFEVSVDGGAGDKVLVSPSPDRMTEYGVSMSQIEDVLRMQEFDSLPAIQSAFLNQAGLRLDQVAGVRVGQAPGTTISRTNGNPSVNISITKEAAANTVTTANAVLEEAATLQADLPAGLELVTIMDQSDYIEASVADLTNNALIGSALAIVVVFLFLMAFRASLVTAISIPLSLLIGFLVMRFTNITINVLTLSAMIVAVGRVIDNSIVILEVVYRRMQQGERFADAAINGVREVVAPITSATAATVVIFLPLGFVGGIVGEMFIPFGLTITYALVGSLLIALTVVPALSGYLLRVKPQKAATSSWYLRAYSVTLGWCLRHRLATIAVAVLLFLGSFVLVPIIGTSFMPDMNTNFLTVEIEMPEGTGIADLKDVVVRAEEVIGTYPDVVTFNSLAGAGSAGGGVAGMFGGGGGSARYANINVTTASGTDSEALAAEIEAALQGITDTGTVTAEALNAMSGGMGSGLELNVRGESLDDIATAADDLIAELQNPTTDGSQGGFRERMDSMQRQALESLTELELNVAEILPKLVIQPDPAKMQAAGLSTEAMQQVQGEFFMMARGATVAQATLDGVPRDIFIEGIASALTSEDAARNLLVGFPGAVPLGEIATAELGEQATRISRMDGKISATITAGIAQQNVGAVNSAVQSRIDSLDLPSGVEIDMGGITEDMQESFSKMFIAIGVAMVLAYAVLVLTFRSFRNPLIIMVSLPLASIGALLGLFATGRPLGVTSLMGILMLVGIVLTNAVVLIAVVEQMRRGGTDPYQAVVDGSRTRLRPILMTALTTMIAMLPLAFGVGEGVLMAAELATVVIGGLFSSTLLTLLVLPVIYSVAYRIRPQPVAVEQE